jgi:hypothetical protein
MSVPTSPPSGALNRDYERRPYWHATMPALASRRDRPLPDAAVDYQDDHYRIYRLK